MDPLSHRVAARYMVAELLTKQWLMGVRRGWVSLLKPPIHDFTDVFRALGRLHQFTTNLREQVYNVRQILNKPQAAPSQRKDEPEKKFRERLKEHAKYVGTQIENRFNALIEKIEDAGSKARHWKDVYDGNTPFPSEEQRQRGEQMLNLYSTNFEGAISTHRQDRGGRYHEASLTVFLDDILKLLYQEAAELAKYEKNRQENLQSQLPGVREFELEHGNLFAEPVFKEFTIGGVKVVVVDPKHNGQRIRAYVDLIDKAHQDIVRKGFGAVWYGVFFLMSDNYERLSKEDQEAYAKAGYKNMEDRAGTYHSGSDIIRITAPPTDFIIRVIVHELGHRYWYKVMSAAQRAKFEGLTEGDYSMLHALLLNHRLLTPEEHADFSKFFAKIESGHELSVVEKETVERKFKELGLRAGVPLVSEYSKSRPTEAFAEVFERYVVESDLTRDQVESFRSVLASDFLLMAPALREEPCPDTYSYQRSSPSPAASRR